MEITKSVFPDTDIFVFHEDFTETDMASLSSIKEYIRVDFSGFDDIFVKHVFPKGYILMCRFFSGQVQRLPQLQNYTHYMRLDDDSFFTEPLISTEQVNSLCSNDYVFRSVFYDLKNHQSLFEWTIDFLKKHGHGRYIPTLTNRLEKTGVLVGSRYTGLAPYNNFHISSIRLWNHPLVVAYVDELERVHGCLRYGWLDANIHAMIIWCIAPLIQCSVYHEGGFGYRHNKHISDMNSAGIRWDDSLSFYPI